ncbi:NHL repeat-containing protein [Coriobacteriia bacterium Es71-Z0120]|uniref:NHL repeat-containing protein n=1 Tax=Parvivirga hydrogeniphila TaxID=2939460 RepID=UPI002260DDF0|nr:NHL repeat-containing protein [Parvivirga hydrogeniphila]MCL4079321.1 NHL repeat-containing protein [Parvivirga hydrogeniphila]
MNRRLVIVIVVLLLVLLGLGGLYVYLAGGRPDAASAEKAKPPAQTGLVPVKSIYMANGENLYRPVGVGADEQGNFFVTLKDGAKVFEFDRNGDYVRSWGERGLQAGQLMAPLGVAVDRLSGHVYVTDRMRLRLIAYDTQGRYLWEVPVLNALAPVLTKDGVAVLSFGPIALFDSEGQLIKEVGSRGYEKGMVDYPRAAAALPDGSLVVADSNNCRVQRLRLEGEATATALWVLGTPPRFQDDPETLFGVPSGVAVDERGRAFVLDGFRHTITVIDTETGKTIYQFKDLEGQADGLFRLPTQIAYLGDRTFAIADTYNDRVQIVRLLLPEENTVIARSPWLKWLLVPLLLLPLLWLLLRRRAYATGEALEAAAEREELRLVAGALKRVRVLPQVYERFAEVTEREVRMGDFLVRLDTDSTDEDTHAVLADASKPRVRSLSSVGRRVVLVADDEQAAALQEKGVKRTLTLAELAERYRIEE